MVDKDPIECITNSECDLGRKRQPICSAGMYLRNEGKSNEMCTECSQTYYCRAGVRVSQCVAGYICDAGLNTVPNPSIGQCPEAYYCPKGNKVPVRCPFETMSVQTAQRQISDCRGCQPGWVCEWGNYDYYPCPKGHWCPVMGDNNIYTSYVNECQPGTYSSWDKRVFMNECSVCPEGYACEDYAITNLTTRECPSGHWCPQGTAKARPCPPGTYFEFTGAVYETDCQICPAGKYCPEGTSEPIECSPGHYCLQGSVGQITCPGGSYCRESTNF